MKPLDKPESGIPIRFLGISLALVGPGVIALLSNWFATNPETLFPRAVFLVLFVTLVVGVVLLATRLEGSSWESLGFGTASGFSLLKAVPLTVFFIFAFGPAAYWFLSVMDMQGFESGIARLDQLPFGYLILSIIIVGASEEWLYRAYAIERLERLTGSTGIAVVVSLVIFALVHYPLWGAGPAVTTLVSGAILAGLYVYTRDIVMLMVAHVATDVYGIALLNL